VNAYDIGALHITFGKLVLTFVHPIGFTSHLGEYKIKIKTRHFGQVSKGSIV
jgi:hypothetical protein